MASGLIKEQLTDPRDLALLTMMESSAQRGATIIRQLLMFSRGVTGERVVVQLSHLLKEMLGIMRETFPREIAVVDACPTQMSPVVGDATQLHQILMNLCVNARDAMPEGGKLTLRAREADLTPAAVEAMPQGRPGRFVQISVEDTGHGIPPEIIERIFDPFFTTKELGKGTGLGLSTVLGIVKSHEGFVTVRSEPGRGTTFDVYLPVVAEAGPTGAAESEAPQPAGQGEMILVVDDESQISATTHLLLERHNYRVLTAANGRDALARFIEHQGAIKLVLTDLMMPVMSGVALIRALRSMQANLRIIATTGLNHERSELAALGVADWIEKPYTPDVLLTAVRRVLDQS
jgi:CheY-like chemotaxis protein